MNIIDEFSTQDVRNNAPLGLWKGPTGTEVRVRLLSIDLADQWLKGAHRVGRKETLMGLYQRKAAEAEMRLGRHGRPGTDTDGHGPEERNQDQAQDQAQDRAGPVTEPDEAELLAAVERTADELERIRGDYFAALSGSVREYLELSIGLDAATQAMAGATYGQVIHAFQTLYALTDPTVVTVLSQVRESKTVTKGTKTE
jgi:hypothetical protein